MNLIPSFVFAQLTVTEVMHRSASLNLRDQFIEIECTDSNGFNFQNHRLRISGIEHTISPVYGNPIVPYGYAIIHPRDYPLNQGRYEDLIPLNTPRFTINEGLFCGNGIPLTDTVTIQLINPNLEVVSIFPIYSIERMGRSLERIYSRIEPLDSNWNWSLQNDGTPGRRNSVSPPLYDVAITNIQYSPRHLQVGLPTLEVSIENRGELPVFTSITIFFKRNSISPFQVLRNFTMDTYQPISESRTSFHIPYLDTLQGIVQFKGTINLVDENLTNNEFVSGHSVWNTVVPVFSELMVNPIQGQPKWIEFYWGSPNAVNLSDWKINIQNHLIVLPQQLNSISNGERFLISTNQLPSQFNVPSNRVIVIPDFTISNYSNFTITWISSWGDIIEEMNYLDSQFPNIQVGRSIVRRSFASSSNNPANWFLSTDSLGCSPGRVNSPPDTFDVRFPTPNSTEKIVLKVKKFSPLNKSSLPSNAHLEVATIGGNYEFSIYQLNGKLIKKELFRFSNGIHNYFWDGLDKQGKIVDCGIYLITIQKNQQLIHSEPVIVAW